MRSFYLVYGTLLLLVSVAFSYLESRSKDQRILKAKVAHAYQLARDKECREAFNLLTQYKQPFLATYYEGKSPDQMQQLESRLCKALQNAKKPAGKGYLVQRLEGRKQAQDVYHVPLPAKSGSTTGKLVFKRELGELILTKVSR